MTRDGTGWSEARSVGAPVNTEGNEACPSLSEDGSLSWHAVYADGPGQSDIYCSKRTADGWSAPEALGPGVNSAGPESNAFVLPDGSAILFGARRPGGAGRSDLYVSFRQSNGEWGEAVPLGPAINTEASEYCPSLSPDGRFLFFTRIVEGGARHGDIFWVDAKLVFELRP